MVLSELIKEYKEMCLEDVPVEEVLEDLQKLEGIYKPKDVPQFVVDWYEEYKDNLEYNIWDWMKYNLEPKKRENAQFSKWIASTENHPVETLVSMKLFGYSVDKEKKYIIKLKNVQKGSESFKFDKVIGKWYFGLNQESSTARLYHTKEDLVNAGFEWMFNCPGIEIEEVEE